MEDLFGDLPPEASSSATTTASGSSAPHASFGGSATSLKPRTTLAGSSHLMQPPKRPAPRPAGGMAPASVRAKTTAASIPAQPIDIHAPSSGAAASSSSAPSRPRADSGSSHSNNEGDEGQDNWESLEGPGAYDPGKPNDYMEYCKQRLEAKKQEERKRELEKYMKEKGAEEERLREQRRLAGGDAFPPPQQLPPASFHPTAQPLPQPQTAAVAAAAAVGRGRGRGGISNLPAWMIKQQQEQGGGAIAAASAGEPVARNGQGARAAAEEGRFEDAEGGGGGRRGGGGGGKSLGNMLLKKMGYKPGEGLGRDAQGITKPIQYRAVGGGQGTVSGPSLPTPKAGPAPGFPPSGREQAAAAGGAAGRRKRGLFSNPTKVVLLKNMVGPGEVDDELHVETKEECEKHGPVREVLIFEVQGSELPREERVRIFVGFERQESAVKAYVAMNGRFFGGQQVQASFFDEERFAKKDLAPRPGE